MTIQKGQSHDNQVCLAKGGPRFFTQGCRHGSLRSCRRVAVFQYVGCDYHARNTGIENDVNGVSRLFQNTVPIGTHGRGLGRVVIGRITKPTIEITYERNVIYLLHGGGGAGGGGSW
eukprot:scaffold34682_cov243-Amphora_coffeaeformis.AAC.1